MSVRLRPYTTYKDSGVPMLGQVPEHWQVLKLRHIQRQVTVRGRADLPLLSVVREKGVILRDISSSEENHNCIPEDLTNHKVVRKGQFAMNKMKAWQGSYGVSRHDGTVSPAYFVFDVDKVDGAYFHSAIRSKAYVPFFGQASDGVRIGQWDLSQTQMKEIPFFTPPLAEEIAIVRYLDYMDRRIRRYIRSKQKLVKLLEEQKQAILHQAVTGQIDVRTGRPYPAYEDSAVPWLGKVPKHWSLLPNGSLVRRRKVLVGERHAEYQLLSLTKEGVIIRDVESGKGKFSADMGTCQQVRAGDLIFCLFDVPETPRTVGLSRHDGMITGAYTLFECSDLALSEFLELFYRAMDDRKLLSPLYSGLRNTILPSRFLRAKTPVPPPDERGAIVRYLEDVMASADEAIRCTKRGIDLLREYRTRLITDVVTGKLDVRDATASLPDDFDKLASCGDEDMNDEDEEASETAELEPAFEEVEV